MGRFNKMFKKLERKAQKLLDSDSDNEDSKSSSSSDDERLRSNTDDAAFDNSSNPTRWEKATVGLAGMVKQVSKVDPDGLDIVCFGGSTDPNAKLSVYRNVKNLKDIEKMVTSKLPSGPCHMGKAMDFVLREAFDRGFKKRPCGILVLTAGCPDDSERLEKSLQDAATRIAKEGYKESPLSVTFVHVGDDPKAEEYMQHLASDMTSLKRSKKTGKTVDIVDTIKNRDINAAMKEIKGTKSSGTTGAIVGAFAGAAMGVGGVYMYNKHQAKKRTEGWNGNWKASYDGFEVATLHVKDDLLGNLQITGFPGGPTTGRYAEHQQKYNITFRDADENWIIKGEIDDEHTIYWTDGTRWDEIPPKGVKFKHYAGAAVAGAAAGGAVGYLLDKKFFKKAHKKDQADYVIVVDRSAKMAIQDKPLESDDDDDEDYLMVEEYVPDDNDKDKDYNFFESVTKKMDGMSTGEKVAVGVAGAATVAGVAAAGVGVSKAVKSHKNNKNNNNNNNNSGDEPVAVARALSCTHSDDLGGLNGRWRSTYDGDEIASITVKDDQKNGILTITGFMGGNTCGKYIRNSVQRITKIHFIDADENWPVNGDVKGDAENVILWSDDTRWDRIH